MIAQLGKPENGMALVMVLIFITVLLILGGAVLTYAMNELMIAGYHADELALYYIAESGIEAGIAALNGDISHRESLAGELAGGTYRVEFTDLDSGIIRLTATGELEKYRQAIIAEVAPGEDGTLHISWIRP